jgi:hypothetical protein
LPDPRGVTALDLGLPGVAPSPDEKAKRDGTRNCNWGCVVF